MEYPTRNLLRQWILENRPELLQKDAKACTWKKRLVKYSQEQMQAAVETILIDGVLAYKVAAQYGVSKATILTWKRHLLGKDCIASMAQDQNTIRGHGELEAEIDNLKLQIKRLQMERDALEKAAELLKKAGGINLTHLKKCGESRGD